MASEVIYEDEIVSNSLIVKCTNPHCAGKIILIGNNNEEKGKCSLCGRRRELLHIAVVGS